MKFLMLLIFLSTAFLGAAQVVFSESFDEADDATTGSDAIGPATWSTAVPGSVAVTDYFKVLSGKLEAQDTNSPSATWTTGDIDVSSCPLGFNISFQLEEEGGMEECIDCGGTGVVCIDWVKLEYNLDGMGWTEIAGETCPLAESPGELIQVGDIAGGGPITYNSPCIDFGTTVQIRISCMCWAASERWLFDDITVSCLDCLLPVEVENLRAEDSNEGTLISWTTLSERSTDYFTVERSYDGIDFELLSEIKGAGTSSQRIDYSFLDSEIRSNATVYYRLRQIDLDGKANYSKSISHITPTYTEIYTAQNQLFFNFEKSQPNPVHLNIYNLNGQLIHQSIQTESGAIPWNKKGFFIVEIPELNFHQKVTAR